MVSFEDFKKLDIRIGEILSAEIVPDTDKLLKLSVDVGEEEPRQIISGIREYIEDPQDLMGLKTPFVLNLPPREIKGIDSNGMLFAVGGDVGLSFLIPDKDIKPGSRLV